MGEEKRFTRRRGDAEGAEKGSGGREEVYTKARRVRGGGGSR